MPTDEGDTLSGPRQLPGPPPSCGQTNIACLMAALDYRWLTQGEAEQQQKALVKAAGNALRCLSLLVHSAIASFATAGRARRRRAPPVIVLNSLEDLVALDTLPTSLSTSSSNDGSSDEQGQTGAATRDTPAEVNGADDHDAHRPSGGLNSDSQLRAVHALMRATCQAWLRACSCLASPHSKLPLETRLTELEYLVQAANAGMAWAHVAARQRYLKASSPAWTGALVVASTAVLLPGALSLAQGLLDVLAEEPAQKPSGHAMRATLETLVFTRYNQMHRVRVSVAPWPGCFACRSSAQSALLAAGPVGKPEYVLLPAKHHSYHGLVGIGWQRACCPIFALCHWLCNPSDHCTSGCLQERAEGNLGRLSGSVDGCQTLSTAVSSLGSI